MGDVNRSGSIVLAALAVGVSNALYTGEPIPSVSISLSNLLNEGEEQISLFDNIVQREKEVKLTKAMDEIRDRFGKNSILRGISYTNSATARYQNTLLGGHKA